MEVKEVSRAQNELVHASEADQELRFFAQINLLLYLCQCPSWGQQQPATGGYFLFPLQSA